MSNKWTALGVLPSVNVKPGYFSSDYLSLVGVPDPRYQEALVNGPNLVQFLGKFEGSHGELLRPSLLIRSDAYPDRPTAEAISSFRDIVVASIVLDVRVRTVTWRRNVGPVYADSFDIYPWMISPDGRRLVSENAAHWAIHDLDRFRGTASPTVPVQEVGHEPAHPRFFAQLYSLWKARYIEGSDNWSSRAVLRSLNMVTSALRLSSATGSSESFYDYGRALALWVSAFEILVHPGPAGTVNRQKVLDLISSIPWRSKILLDETHQAGFGGANVGTVRLANALYAKMYNLRNDFLHGNPVEPAAFRLLNATSILDYPAAIFRMALSTVLPDPDEIAADDVIAEKRTRDEYWLSIQQTAYKNDCEECLQAAVKPRPADDE